MPGNQELQMPFVYAWPSTEQALSSVLQYSLHGWKVTTVLAWTDLQYLSMSLSQGGSER